MEYISGKIFIIHGIKKGYLCIDKNKIVETGKGLPPKKPKAKGLIVPTFINAHTHIGDSFIRSKKIKLPKDVEKLVAPPNGLKHRLLNEAKEQEIIKGMKTTISEMNNSGISTFLDFREGGVSGINQLNKALLSSKISAIIFSRPKELYYNKNEIEILLKNSQGIGISSISDWDYSELKKISSHVKKKKKLFAIHASERIRENIDDILELKPDFLVHMVKANQSDLINVKENNIPIVLCLRSNSFYGLKPNIKLMKKTKVNLLLGTDNAMLNSASIIDEIKFIKKNFKEFSLHELLYMSTYAPRKTLNLKCDILGANLGADYVVLDEKTLKPKYV